jgi:hypothetical protein
LKKKNPEEAEPTVSPDFFCFPVRFFSFKRWAFFILSCEESFFIIKGLDFDNIRSYILSVKQTTLSNYIFTDEICV